MNRENKKLVRATYPHAWACHFPDVAADGPLMRGGWVVYTSRRTKRRLGRGADQETAWRDAAARVQAEC
jgi:hypothetical protein